MLALALGAAGRGASRGALLAGILDAIARRGLYADSREQLTPALRDPPSLLPLSFVLSRLLISPRRALDIAARSERGHQGRVEARPLAGLRAPAPAADLSGRAGAAARGRRAASLALVDAGAA